MSKPDSRTGVTSPPAGTGNVPGLGEAFRINLNTGQGIYSYKIALPDGIAGHSPQLTLEYAHGTGLGSFGLGWRLPIRTITRRLDLGVTEAGDAERFLDGGAEIVEMTDGSFAALTETSFTRYTRVGDGWRIEERNGLVHELGSSAATRISDQDHPDRIHEYLLSRSLDTSGNAVTYNYLIHDGLAYISEVRYAAYAVRFTYEDRPDVRRDGRAGFLRVRTKRCQRIELYLDPGPQERRIRSWSFVYEVDPVSAVSLLKSIRMVSHGTAPDGSQDVARNPVTFEYSRFDTHTYSIHFLEAPEGPQPPPLNDPDAALVILDDAPLPGVLHIANGRQHYWGNRGDGTWSYPRSLGAAPPVVSFAASGVTFIDVDGSGTADMVIAGVHPLHGYYENGGKDGWTDFVAYPRGNRATPEWTSGRIRLADTDGNGLIDAMMSSRRAFTVWSNRGSEGWAEPFLSPKGIADERPDVDFDDPLVQLADMTGHGLQDLVRLRSGRVEYWPSLGNGRFGARVLMLRSPRLRELEREPGNSFMMDVDGDGCADMVRVSARGVEIYFNRNGTLFSDPVLIDTVPVPLPGTVRVVNMAGRAGSSLMWNSLRGRETVYVQLEFSTPQPPYLLTTIDNGSGLVSQLFYRSAVEDYLDDFKQGFRWGTNLPFPLLVAAGSKETDQVTGQINETRYRYHEGHFEPSTRQFQGFKRAERIEVGDESRADVLTVFHYLMAEERQPGHGPEHASLNGLQRRVETFSLDGSAQQELPHRMEECTYNLQILGLSKDGRKRIFGFASLHRVEDRERTEDARIEEKTYTYDALGNVVLERLRGLGTRGDAAVAERERITEIEYAQSTTRWIIDRPSRVVVRDETNTIIAEKRRYYDGQDFRGLALGLVDRGLLSREEKLVMSETDFQGHYAGMDAAALGYHAASDLDGTPSRFENSEQNAYDAKGLKIAQRDALGNEQHFKFDPVGLFRTKLTDALGETRFEYDRATGQQMRIIYGDGRNVQFTYDAQGRVRTTLLPGDSEARSPRRFTYNDVSIPHSRTAHFRTAANSSTEAVSYFDGRGKEFQQRVEAGGGRVVVSALSIRNPWGDVKQEYEPSEGTSLAFALPDMAGRPRRELYYDGRGRVVRTVDYGGGISLAEYRPFEMILHDANDTDTSPANIARGQANTPRREEFDVFRDRTLIVENMGGGAIVQTSFVVGSRGDVLQIADERSVICTCDYDKLGRRLRVSHREAGIRRMWYDGRDKVVRTQDANGSDLRAELDELGRLKRLRAGRKLLERYTYDDLSRNALGRLAEVKYPGGRQLFHYDVAGRLIRRVYRFEGVAKAHTLRYKYDLLGRETAIVHTDGTRISRQLTPNGWIQAIPGFLNEVAYDPRGRPTRLTFANGVVTEITYTPGPGRVKTQRTVRPSGQVMEDITYQYDKLQMLISQNDSAPGGTGSHTFDYDPLYQLRQATSTEGGAAVTRPYEYVDHYNLTRLDEAGNLLHYDDGVRPNRLTGITQGAAPRFDPGYDANGNLLTLPSKTFHYNEKGELERFEGARGLKAEYRYDHEGRRISKTVTKRQGATVRTLFLGSEAEIRNNTEVYFVNLGELRVGIIQGNTKRFVHSNCLGSTAFFSDSAGQKIAAIAYRPFGNVASSSGDVDVRTYGAHPFDTESGLYYMKRRYYAPEIARFLTADPLVIYQPQKVMSRPRALHPYAYSGNDPLNNADPQGLSFWSVVGAIVGVIAAVALAALVVVTGGLILGIVIAIGVVAVSYIVADATAGSGFGEFMRGFMIGFNAGLNAIIATALFGPVVGIALGVINFLAAFDGIASSPIYQGILGWSSWLMPMSWLATAIGLIFFVINVVVAFFTYWIPGWLGFGGWDAARINSISIDWGTGTIVTHGGLLTPMPGGYNLGNFTYINRNSTFSTSLLQHETGHTLNVAAYGSIFHFVGAIDENVIPNRGANAYAEKLADSHDLTSPPPDPSVWQEMWV